MDASICTRQCDQYWWCDEVQVVRVSNLPHTVKAPVNAPYLRWNQTEWTPEDLPSVGPCGYLTHAERELAGCKWANSQCSIASMGLQPDDYICYAATFEINPFLQANDGFQIATEPDDPIFYSTCMFKSQPNKFLPHPKFRAPEPGWRAGDYCVDCEYLNRVKSFNSTTAPRWDNYINFDEVGCKVC